MQGLYNKLKYIGVTVVLVFSSTNERFEETKESFMEQVQEDNNNIPNYNVDIPSITGSRFQCEVWQKQRKT